MKLIEYKVDNNQNNDLRWGAFTPNIQTNAKKQQIT